METIRCTGESMSQLIVRLTHSIADDSHVRCVLRSVFVLGLKKCYDVRKRENCFVLLGVFCVWVIC